MADKSILAEADFNLTKTWIEYVNRLVGVIIGFLIGGLFWVSLKLRRERRPLFWISLTTLAAVIVQGWFGSIVVSTNLTNWTITVHMFLALAIVGLLIYLYHFSAHESGYRGSLATRILLLVCMTLLLVQIFLGTRVREAIDMIAGSAAARESWIAQLGPEFLIHRSFSWLVLIMHVILVVKLGKTSANKVLSLGLIVIILGALAAGITMAYGSVPAFLQPVHLVLATGAFGVQLLLLFQLKTEQKVSV